MSVLIKTMARKNPRDLSATEKFYAAAISNGDVNMEKLAELISFQSTLTPSDIYAVLLSLEYNIASQLEDGKIVKLGSIGSFQVSVSSEGMTTAEEVSANAITKSRILFRPGKKLRKLLRDLSFHKAG